MHLIHEKRDSAAKTRRLAASLTWSEDRERLMRFAQELDDEAASLEQEARGSSAFNHSQIDTGAAP